MKEKRKLKVYSIKILYILVISIMISTIISGIRGIEIKNCIKDFIFGHGQLMKERVIDFSENGEISDNDVKIFSDDDGFHIIITEIDDYVQEISLDFDEYLKSNVNIETFFTSDKDEPFSELKRVFTDVVEGEKKQLLINIRRKVCNLQINIIGEISVTNNLSSVVLNKDSKKFSIKRFISIIYANRFTPMWWDRVVIFTSVFVFLGICFLFNTEKTFSVLFQYRWFAAGIILLFLVINRYNGDSLVMYDAYIQQGEGNEYIETIVGKGRAIRSDEWVVDTPISLSTQFLDDPYGAYNNIIRGTDTVNDNQIAFYSLVNPISIIGILLEKTFGYDYKYSFGWYMPIVLSFLVTIEFFIIITKGKKLLSITGTCMILMSSYYLWWGFPTYILYVHGAFVCAYYFFCTEIIWKKVLFGYGTSICTASFILVLYPAWQVPIGYVALAILVWMLYENWNKIKLCSKSDLLIIACAVLLVIGMILNYLCVRIEYVNSITQTVYPSKRVELGGFSVNKLFHYCAALLFSFKDVGNASENGVCISFFPVPMLVAIWLWIKSKKKDWLIAGLLIIGVFLTIYTTIGFPLIIAKCTLMTYSTAKRAVDILGYIQVLLFIRVYSIYENDNKFSKAAASMIAICISAATVFFSNKNLPGYMGKLYMAVIFVIIAAIMFIMMSNCLRKIQRQMYIMIIVISLITGVYIRPIEKGTDAIYSKPLAKEMQTIVNKDSQAKWLAVGAGIVLPSFMIACGARTINSVNKYPNMELWQKLDPTGKYNEIYNRYAHISLEFTKEETSMELIEEDDIQLNLSYKDILLTEAKYIGSVVQLNVNNEYVTFSKLYSEAGSYIYEIQYH